MRKPASQAIIVTTTWNKDLNKGDKIEGHYIRKEVFEGKYGESTKYVIKNDDGDFGVFSSASLDRQFRNIPEGSYVWIEYDGEVISKNGRPVKQYIVEYDDEYEN
ncbi:MAG: hypothetical protein J6S85_01175 [Methanobrevibacter sp.]|nr:hypothetical protein [Methanobrevibacter sp.]